jgi:hypothetical protein
MAAENREQHGHTVGIEPLGDAARRPEAHPVDEALQLDQQWPAAIAHHGDDAARRRLRRAREKNRGRVAHFLKPRVAHGEESELVRRAEAVLGRTHQAITAAGLAFKIQDRINQMLEQARACDGTLLGHVADDDHRGAARLGKAHEPRCAFAQLRHGPGERRGLTQLHGLDGVDDEKPDFAFNRQREHLVEVALIHEGEMRRNEPEAMRAQSHLRHGLFAARVQHGTGLRYMRRHLQQQGRLTDARIATEQRNRSGEKTPAQDAIKLVLPRHETLGIRARRPCEAPRPRRGRPAGGCARRARGALFQRVPGRALRALPLPFRGLRPAGAARKDTGGTYHRLRLSKGGGALVQQLG